MLRHLLISFSAVAIAAGCGGSSSSHGDGGAGSGDGGGGGSSDGSPGSGAGSVVTHHNGPSRDGVYTDGALTVAAVSGMHMDTTFQAQLDGPTYAQPLYLASGGSGPDLVIAATEQNTVYAFDADDGSVVWQKTLGDPVPLADLPCGDINPLGITGTPSIDPRTRTIYLDAMTTPDGGTTKQHLAFALDADSGDVVSGWPVDIAAKIDGFTAELQNQRAAILLSGGHMYIAYGGHAGDCGNYRGWVIDVPIDDPQNPGGWSTPVRGGGIWAPSGPASDGSAVYVATGNTFGADTYSQGEAIIRLTAGPVFTGNDDDFYAPLDWKALDDADLDTGGQGPILVDVPGATPEKLVVALGKNGDAYLLDRAHLGGISAGLDDEHVADSAIIGAAAAYHTSQGTYVAFRAKGVGCPQGQSGGLVGLKIAASNPPKASVAWCQSAYGGKGSPIFTTTGGGADPLVWIIGTESNDSGSEGHLHAVNADTGEVVWDGGGDADMMGNVRRFEAPIAAHGRVFVAGDDAVYAFTP